MADTQSKIAQRRVNPTRTERWGITAERFKGDSFLLIGRHFPNFFTHFALHLKQTQLKCSVFYVVDMLKFPEEEYRSGIFLSPSATYISIFICILKDANIKGERARLSEVPEHNAVAALPPFVVDFHSNRISFLTGLLPHSETQVTSAGLAASPRNPKIRTPIANKDMRVSDSLLGAMNPAIPPLFPG